MANRGNPAPTMIVVWFGREKRRKKRTGRTRLAMREGEREDKGSPEKRRGREEKRKRERRTERSNDRVCGERRGGREQVGVDCCVTFKGSAR